MRASHSGVGVRCLGVLDPPLTRGVNSSFDADPDVDAEMMLMTVAPSGWAITGTCVYAFNASSTLYQYLQFGPLKLLFTISPV